VGGHGPTGAETKFEGRNGRERAKGRSDRVRDEYTPLVKKSLCSGKREEDSSRQVNSI